MFTLEPHFDVGEIKTQLEQKAKNTENAEISDDLAVAHEVANEYEESMKNDNDSEVTLPPEVKSKMKSFKMSVEFADTVKDLKLPQFVISPEQSSFGGEKDLLTAEDLYVGFSLLDKSAEIDFDNIDAEMAKIDTDDKNGSVPKAWKLSMWGNPLYREFFDSLSPEKKIAQCKYLIVGLLDKDVNLEKAELSDYVERVIRGLTTEQVDDLQQTPYSYYSKIKRKIEKLRALHTEAVFRLWVETEKVTCEPMYQFPKTISPSKFTSSLPRTLYTAEEEMNGLERDVAWFLANENNILWWHRNISRIGFAINGYIFDGNPTGKAYHDIIAMTTSGKIIVVEPKGGYLDGENSHRKVEIGRKWQDLAGKQYRYYMVFGDKQIDTEGMLHFDEFKKIIKAM